MNMGRAFFVQSPMGCVLWKIKSLQVLQVSSFHGKDMLKLQALSVNKLHLQYFILDIRIQSAISQQVLHNL